MGQQLGSFPNYAARSRRSLRARSSRLMFSFTHTKRCAVLPAFTLADGGFGRYHIAKRLQARPVP